MNKKALTLTVVANMTSNYSEGLGNIASVQKVFKNRRIYSMRSRESLKNAIMVQSGWYDDLQTEVDGATQKKVNEDLNAINCRALEAGYMNTQSTTYVRRSSFYLTDAISTEHFISEPRFHNNLYMATNYAKSKGLSVQEPGKNNIGLMPYQYEYDKSLKIYSMTVDLEMIGKDENFEGEADPKEKADRVICLLDAIENLSLVVKGNLDNAEPIFAVGGLSPRKTHFFENVVNVEQAKLIISSDLKNKINQGFYVGLLQGNLLENEEEIENELHPITITEMFDKLRQDVTGYYLD